MACAVESSATTDTSAPPSSRFLKMLTCPYPAVMVKATKPRGVTWFMSREVLESRAKQDRLLDRSITYVRSGGVIFRAARPPQLRRNESGHESAAEIPDTWRVILRLLAVPIIGFRRRLIREFHLKEYTKAKCGAIHTAAKQVPVCIAPSWKMCTPLQGEF